MHEQQVPFAGAAESQARVAAVDNAAVNGNEGCARHARRPARMA